MIGLIYRFIEKVFAEKKGLLRKNNSEVKDSLRKSFSEEKNISEVKVVLM